MPGDTVAAQQRLVFAACFSVAVSGMAVGGGLADKLSAALGGRLPVSEMIVADVADAAVLLQGRTIDSVSE